MAEYSKVENQVLKHLEDVIDPELGIDIINLGLVYGVKVVDGRCTITMTLTTMGCPLGDLLSDRIRNAAMAVPEVKNCDIDLVWEPAWDMSKMSRFAKIALGIHG